MLLIRSMVISQFQFPLLYLNIYHGRGIICSSESLITHLMLLRVFFETNLINCERQLLILYSKFPW